ncbi:MAG: hypothetical protein M3308_06070, partial [Actinomycetota bacterium]|nr:hypothetical protein [Actinomycetota bacterium]
INYSLFTPLQRIDTVLLQVEPTSVRSERSTRVWKVSHRLTEEDVQLLIKEYHAGALRQELADRYKISVSSVGRLLRKHEAKLKDNLS